MTLAEAAAYDNAARRALHSLEAAMARMRAEIERINQERVARGIAPLDFADQVNNLRRRAPMVELFWHPASHYFAEPRGSGWYVAGRRWGVENIQRDLRKVLGLR